MATEKLNGLLVVDKPMHMTSREAVNRLQRLLPRKTRIGHAGTLDPLATGVLVICIGKATRLIEYVQDLEKEYVTDLVLGAVSDTDDAEGKITPGNPELIPDQETLEKALQSFVGIIDQVPPDYSAAKINGQRAYDLARKGKVVSLEARTIQIDVIQLLTFQSPDLQLQIRCGKGTYIRSIARDLGERLGCGGYVRTLRRTRIGGFTAEMAVPFPETGRESLPPLLPLALAVTHLPRVAITTDEARRMQLGQSLTMEGDFLVPEGSGPEVALFCLETLIGIGKWNPETLRLSPMKVL